MNEDDDERPPICPACGVTMGMVAEDAETRFVCWECGFGEDASPRVKVSDPPGGDASAR